MKRFGPPNPRETMRALSSLLIPLMLISQFLISIPHTHAGESVVEPNGHSARPHFHVHKHSHDGDHGSHETHESGDESPSTPLGGGQDHDSDALYGADALLTDNAHSTELPKPELSVLCGELSDSTVKSQWLRCHVHGPPHMRWLQKCPVFLWTLSIRC